MLDRLQQLPLGAIPALVIVAAVIGMGLALLFGRRQR